MFSSEVITVSPCRWARRGEDAIERIAMDG